MFRQRLSLPAAAVLAAVVGSCVAQPVRATPPYSDYGETPGAYDYTTDNQTVVPYSRYGETPGAYTYSASSYGGRYTSSSSSTPSYSYMPSYSYPAPAYAFAPPISRPRVVSFRKGAGSDRLAHIDMRLPANARVFFGDKEMPGSGNYRRFKSPPLTPGNAYTYDIRVTWKDGERTVEKTRRLRVHAGDQLNLNLARGTREAAPVSTPATGQ